MFNWLGISIGFSTARFQTKFRYSNTVQRRSRNYLAKAEQPSNIDTYTINSHYEAAPRDSRISSNFLQSVASRISVSLYRMEPTTRSYVVANILTYHPSESHGERAASRTKGHHRGSGGTNCPNIARLLREAVPEIVRTASRASAP